MAFSMRSIVKRKPDTADTRVNTRALFGIIQNMGILTDSVRTGLACYLRVRLKHYGTSLLTEGVWQNMISSMLEHCCGKPYTAIGQVDVIANQGEIIYQIKNSIYYGKLSMLYVENITESVHSIYMNANISPPKPLHLKTRLNKSDVEDYFKELEII